MDQSELVAAAEAAPPIVRAMAPGLTSAFGTLLRSGQDRKNLEADRAVVNEMLQKGLTNFRFRGLAMEFESFADAHEEEIQRLVTNAVNAALKADSVVDWSKVNLDQFNPEFRRRWILEASNVSDETLQDLWARLLAGELETPGSVSNDTMSIARDMNKERAGEFQILCSMALCRVDRTPMIVVGCGNPGNNSLQPYGLSYEVLMRLAHHRLIVNEMDSGITASTSAAGQITIIVRQQESAWVLDRPADSTANPRISGLLFGQVPVRGVGVRQSFCSNQAAVGCVIWASGNALS
ncbi:MAG: DUF2806 domain-containing protein [Dehalococcoidia bacterium]|nr:DUF2806 domain-containing protein [Dehalococcoidia bacterium]